MNKNLKPPSARVKCERRPSVTVVYFTLKGQVKIPRKISKILSHKEILVWISTRGKLSSEAIERSLRELLAQFHGSQDHGQIVQISGPDPSRRH